MPAFTRDLERTLQRALSIADEKGYAKAALAHLALALADDVDVKELLRACDVDPAALRASLHRIAEDAAVYAGSNVSIVPSAAFDRTIQRAIVHAQDCDREQIAGPQVLVALLAEADDEAAATLRRAGVTYFDATRYVSHGLRKGRERSDTSSASALSSDENMRVMLLNDDFTPMEFVVTVLRDAFGKEENDAVRLMFEIHQRGFASCGTYPRETAAAKVAAVAKLARDHQHPLDCVMEPMRGPSDALLFKKSRTIVASGPGDRQRA